MSNAARFTDLFAGICCNHSKPSCRGAMGVIVTGSDNVITEGVGQARLSDIGITFCGHVFVVIGLADITLTNSLPSARLADPVIGAGFHTIVTGATRTFIGK